MQCEQSLRAVRRGWLSASVLFYLSIILSFYYYILYRQSTPALKINFILETKVSIANNSIIPISIAHILTH